MAGTKARRVIIPPLTLMMLFVVLAGCGGGNECKRACRKIESCLSGGDDSVGASGFVSDCNAAATECNELDACRASCMLGMSCTQLLGGSTELASCYAQCAQTTPAPRNNIKMDSGPLAPIGADGGYCTPNCSGIQCGDDGCGGSCGSCAYNETCDPYGACVSTSSSSTNSGSLCSQTTSCSSGEECMSFESNPNTGMCLGKCQSAGDTCPSSGSQLSICALTSQQNSTQHYCAFFCAYQGQSFACPNSYGYDCKTFDPAYPDIKLCIPK